MQVDWREIAERSAQRWQRVAVPLPSVRDPATSLLVRLPKALVDSGSIRIGPAKPGGEDENDHDELDDGWPWKDVEEEHEPWFPEPPETVDTTPTRVVRRKGNILYFVQMAGEYESWRCTRADKVRISLRDEGVLKVPLEHVAPEVLPFHVVNRYRKLFAVVDNPHLLPPDSVLRYRFKDDKEVYAPRECLVGWRDRDVATPNCECHSPVVVERGGLWPLLNTMVPSVPLEYLEEIPGTRRRGNSRDVTVKCVYPSCLTEGMLRAFEMQKQGVEDEMHALCLGD